MNERPTPEDFRRLGIYDPAAPEAEDRLRLIDYLVDLGATEEQLVEAHRIGAAGGLVLELVLRPASSILTLDQAAEATGLEPEELQRFIRALGFPDPKDEIQLSERSIEQIRAILGGGKQLLGEEASLALARVMGSTMFRLAQALAATFRTNFEAPQLKEGLPYSEVVRQYAELTKNLLPVFFDTLETVFQDHLVAIASGTWTLDEEGGAPRTDLVVGFVDMVGYSALSRGMLSRRLVQVIGRFEDGVSEVVTAHEGHVVKMIGDGAMFIAEDPVEACRAALELVERFGEQKDFPPVHVGLAAGPLITLNGDFFGDAVNEAARLHELAPAGKVLVNGDIAARVKDGFVLQDVSVWFSGADLEGPIYELGAGP